ncbi:MAG: hypothetical protein ACRC2R_02490 [Xenococcaceae cyanobacterium]
MSHEINKNQHLTDRHLTDEELDAVVGGVKPKTKREPLGVDEGRKKFMEKRFKQEREYQKFRTIL